MPEAVKNISAAIKERATVRSSVAKFFLDNARRMWGLPLDANSDDAVKVEVSHKGEAPVDSIPSAPSVPSASITAHRAIIVLGGILFFLVGAAVGLLVIHTLPSNASPSLPQAPEVIQPGSQQSLLQYLEDRGANRP